MAKPKQAPALSSSSDLYEWAAEVLRLRFDEVMSYSNAVLVPLNVNAVHDMRVALRRLRSALRDFVQVIDEKPLKRVKNDLKRISTALGVVRDDDVAIIALEDLAAEAKNGELRNGVEEMIGEFRSKRERSHNALARLLQSVSLVELQRRFSDRIVDSLRQQELFSPGSLSEAGRTVIETRLGEFVGLEPAIYDPADSVRLHELRLAGKRLRYSIELFAACWGEEITHFATELAKLQTLLGDVHDCDVWTAILSKRLTENTEKKTEATAASSVWLLSTFVAKRAKAYRASLDLWSEWQADSFTERLRSVVSISERS